MTTKIATPEAIKKDPALATAFVLGSLGLLSWKIYNLKQQWKKQQEQEQQKQLRKHKTPTSDIAMTLETKQAALNKLAQMKLAINHVLRNRQMTKAAIWPFSKPAPKYRFETDPNWQDDPEAVKEFLTQANTEQTQYVNDAYFDHKWFPKKGPALKLREKDPDLEYLLANKYGLDLTNYGGDAPTSDMLDYITKKDTPLKKNEQALLQDYITSKNTIEKELGPWGDPLGPERIKYHLNRGLQGLAEIDDWMALSDRGGMDRGKDAFATEDFYDKENAVKQLIKAYREKYNRLPKNELKMILDYADLNNKYVNQDTTLNSFDKDFYRILRKDVTDGGKDTLRELLWDINSENDTAPYTLLRNGYMDTDTGIPSYMTALRNDPAYAEIKDKLLALGKKYNL